LEKKNLFEFPHVRFFGSKWHFFSFFFAQVHIFWQADFNLERGNDQYGFWKRNLDKKLK